VTIVQQRRIEAQPGPQRTFLATSADLAIYGGAAYGGKTFALLLEPLRHSKNPNFGAVIFRRTYPQVTNEGGLWDTSQQLYPLVGAKPRESDLSWRFPSGASVKFAHLQYEANKIDWQGAQVPLIGWDELTHFTEGQFWYLFGRNRSMCGVRPYTRATCNPDPDSFVRVLIDWWIGEDGFAIPERSGRIRWFVRYDGELHWADGRDELAGRFRLPDGESIEPTPSSRRCRSSSANDCSATVFAAATGTFARPPARCSSGTGSRSSTATRPTPDVSATGTWRRPRRSRERIPTGPPGRSSPRRTASTLSSTSAERGRRPARSRA
jgi:hypothetical protein